MGTHVHRTPGGDLSRVACPPVSIPPLGQWACEHDQAPAPTLTPAPLPGGVDSPTPGRPGSPTSAPPLCFGDTEDRPTAVNDCVTQQLGVGGSWERPISRSRMESRCEAAELGPNSST